MKSIISYSLAIVALFSFGCASTRSFKVDAIAANAPVTNRTYHIVPANPQVPDNDLRFIEAAGIVEKALSSHGYIRTDDSAKTAIIIAMEASVGQPENVAVSRPSDPIDADFGFYHMVRVPVRNRFGDMCYIRTMVWSPNYMYVDHSNVSMATVYEKRLTLTAFANNGDKDLPQLWSVVVTQRGESSDIRSMLPMMAITAAKYVESDTKGQVISRLETKDPEVIRISPFNKDTAK